MNLSLKCIKLSFCVNILSPASLWTRLNKQTSARWASLAVGRENHNNIQLSLIHFVRPIIIAAFILIVWCRLTSVIGLLVGSAADMTSLRNVTLCDDSVDLITLEAARTKTLGFWIHRTIQNVNRTSLLCEARVLISSLVEQMLYKVHVIIYKINSECASALSERSYV